MGALQVNRCDHIYDPGNDLSINRRVQAGDVNARRRGFTWGNQI